MLRTARGTAGDGVPRAYAYPLLNEPLDLTGSDVRTAGRGFDYFITDIKNPQLADAAREADVPAVFDLLPSL